MKVNKKQVCDLLNRELGVDKKLVYVDKDSIYDRCYKVKYGLIEVIVFYVLDDDKTFVDCFIKGKHVARFEVIKEKGEIKLDNGVGRGDYFKKYKTEGIK